jgi:hypothetical protein
MTQLRLPVKTRKLVNKHDLPHHHGLQDDSVQSDPNQKEVVWQFVLPATREDQKMTGAGTCFGNIMFMHGLPAPLIQNPRARFYFTERGWNKVGRFVTSEARKKGFVMRVIRQKNPAASQIVYRDDLQVALLPMNWKRKDR